MMYKCFAFFCWKLELQWREAVMCLHCVSKKREEKSIRDCYRNVNVFMLSVVCCSVDEKESVQTHDSDEKCVKGKKKLVKSSF